MLRFLAQGKINWTLDIVGIRDDGYHLMDMLMSTVELADELELIPAEELSLSVVSEKESLLTGESHENNLVWKAAQILQKTTGCRKGAAMRLHKRIPVGAGMGGGSADAAAALRGLCRLWELSVSEKQMADMALSLGADVPFLLQGGLARVQGIGEKIQPLPFAKFCWLVLVQPCFGLSTPEIFRAFDASSQKGIFRPQTQAAQAALLAGDFPALARAMGNVMEPVSLRKCPEMREALCALEALGALRAMMTGSGSVVYGVFESKEKAQAACASLRLRWEKTYLTRTAEKDSKGG